MTKYTGIPCPACGREFTEQDDVVVCPECGAPHHRACYQEAGQCALSTQHTPGFAWQGPTPPPSDLPPIAEVPPGSQVPPDYQHHFQPQEGSPQISRPIIDLEDQLSEIPMRDVAQYVGPGAYYYLPRFKLMSLTQRTFLPCLSAVFLSFFYYFNRKMYKIGMGLLALFLLMSIPILVVSYQVFPEMMAYILNPNSPPPNLSAYETLLQMFSFFQILFFGATLVTGLYANKLYFNHVVRQIRQIRSEYQGRIEHEYHQALAIRGRTNKFAVVAVAVGLFLCYMAFQVLIATTYSNIL